MADETDDEQLLWKVLEARAGGACIVNQEPNNTVCSAENTHIRPCEVRKEEEQLSGAAAKQESGEVTMHSQNQPAGREGQGEENGEMAVPGAYAMPGIPPDPGSDEGVEEPLDEEHPNDSQGDENSAAIDAVLVTEEAPIGTERGSRNQRSRPRGAAVVAGTPAADLGAPQSVAYPVAIPEEEIGPANGNIRDVWMRVLCVALGVIAVTISVLLGLSSSGALRHAQPGKPAVLRNATQSAFSPTLDRIKERGFLRCMTTTSYHYFPSLLDHALCKAVAAAIFGSADHVELVESSISNFVQKDMYDLFARQVTHTMQRQVFEGRHTMSPQKFSISYVYGGITAIGIPFYIDCIDNHLKHVQECSDIKICVPNESWGEEFIESVLPQRKLIVRDDLWPRLVARDNSIRDDCHVIVMADYFFSEDTLEEDIAVSNATFARAPVGLVMHPDDPVFVDFVNSVVGALLAAEAHNITRDSAGLFPLTQLFGPDYQSMFRDAVLATGNFAEMLAQTVAPFVPRSLVNQINDGTTGLLYPHPVGPIGPSHGRGELPLGGIMQSVLDRGALRCGVHLHRVGFATITSQASYTGMDVDLCRAVAAALFQGDVEAVRFVDLASPEEGYLKLASGHVDVVAGALWNLENDVNEPATNMGYAFSQPYFYGYSQEIDNFCMATMQRDHDWLSFVYWVVEAIIFAEDRGITRASSYQMPEVHLFGPALDRMFKDAVWAVGNYADIYSRHVQTQFPRGGRNMLSPKSNPGPQHYILDGFV